MPVMFDVPALDPPTIGSIGSALQRGRETAAGPSGSGHESDITAAAAAAAAAVTPAGGGQSRRALPAPPAAVEQRALHWIAFSQRCVAAHSQETALAAGGGCGVREGSTAEEVGDQLASAIPYILSLSDVYIRAIHASVLPEQLAFSLNGAIVGLCGKHHNGGGGSSGRGDESDALLSSNGGLAPCLGLGLIRTADGASGKLYIVTPLSLEELEKVDLIEIGRLELPPTLLQTGKFLSPYLALHSLSTAGTGAGVIKSRNNLMRSSQR
jgi:polynucleotide 5'-hydroxyl-kinase GRC3/NOL9